MQVSRLCFWENAMVDHSAMKLGKIAPIETPHIKNLSAYKALMPPAFTLQPPQALSWATDIDWPLLANDHVGDCVPAAMLHYIQAAERWRDGVGRTPTDAQALYAYSQLSSYPAADTGCLISAALQTWMTNGLKAADGLDKISALIPVNINDVDELRLALWLFGPLIVGAQLPVAAKKQARWTRPLDMTDDNARGSWGGHCMLLTGWGASGVATADLVTWGAMKQADAGWLSAYADECWAVLHPTWTAAECSPAGIPIDVLQQEMQKLAA